MLRNVLLNSVNPNDDTPGPSTSAINNPIPKQGSTEESFVGGTLKFLEDLMIQSKLSIC